MKSQMDKTEGILDRDVDGKPIRKGSIVEPALPPEMVRDECAGQMEVVSGERIAHIGRFALVLVTPEGLHAFAEGKHLRVVEDGHDNDQSSWGDVERETGWRPRAVEPEAVPDKEMSP